MGLIVWPNYLTSLQFVAILRGLLPFLADSECPQTLIRHSAEVYSENRHSAEFYSVKKRKFRLINRFQHYNVKNLFFPTKTAKYKRRIWLKGWSQFLIPKKINQIKDSIDQPHLNIHLESVFFLSLLPVGISTITNKAQKFFFFF